MFIFCGKFSFTFSTGLDEQLSKGLAIFPTKWQANERLVEHCPAKKALRCLGSPKRCSLNGGTPISHPKMVIFSRKIHGCWVPPFQETPIYKTESNAFVQPRSSSVQATFCWKGDDSVGILSCPWDPRDWYIYLHFTIKIKHSCR